jgi:hypothetical protein
VKRSRYLKIICGGGYVVGNGKLLGFLRWTGLEPLALKAFLAGSDMALKSEANFNPGNLRAGSVLIIAKMLGIST